MFPKIMKEFKIIDFSLSEKKKRKQKYGPPIEKINL